MSESGQAFRLQPDKSKLYNDLLRFILIRVIPGDTSNQLKELQRISAERWTAIEYGDQDKADELEEVENELVQQIIDAAPKRS